jgi:hypothetical protein
MSGVKNNVDTPPSTPTISQLIWPRFRHFLGGSASGVALVLAGREK